MCDRSYLFLIFRVLRNISTSIVAIVAEEGEKIKAKKIVQRNLINQIVRLNLCHMFSRNSRL